MKTLMTFILSVGVVALYTMQGISATSGAMSSGKVETRKAVFVLAPSTECLVFVRFPPSAVGKRTS